jgi:hypothetical protein
MKDKDEMKELGPKGGPKRLSSDAATAHAESQKNIGSDINEAGGPQKKELPKEPQKDEEAALNDKEKTFARLFVGFFIPEELWPWLKGLEAEYPDRKFVPHPKTHVTFSYLGDVDEDLIPLIKQHLSAIKFPRISGKLYGYKRCKGLKDRLALLFSEVGRYDYLNVLGGIIHDVLKYKCKLVLPRKSDFKAKKLAVEAELPSGARKKKDGAADGAKMAAPAPVSALPASATNMHSPVEGEPPVQLSKKFVVKGFHLVKSVRDPNNPDYPDFQSLLRVPLLGTKVNLDKALKELSDLKQKARPAPELKLPEGRPGNKASQRPHKRPAAPRPAPRPAAAHKKPEPNFAPHKQKPRAQGGGKFKKVPALIVEYKKKNDPEKS